LDITLPDVDNLKDFVDWRVRESRDINGNLNYQGPQNSRKEIADCLVFNIENTKVIKVSQIHP
jgi:hypothetical protein